MDYGKENGNYWDSSGLYRRIYYSWLRVESFGLWVLGLQVYNSGLFYLGHEHSTQGPGLRV